MRLGQGPCAAAGLTPKLIRHMREAHPDLDVELLEQKTIRLIPRVPSGRLDVAIIPPETLDTRLEYRHLFHEAAVVAVPRGHPLSDRSDLTVSDMADEPLILPERRSRPHSNKLTMKLFIHAGQSTRPKTDLNHFAMPEYVKGFGSRTWSDACPVLVAAYPRCSDLRPAVQWIERMATCMRQARQCFSPFRSKALVSNC